MAVSKRNVIKNALRRAVEAYEAALSMDGEIDAREIEITVEVKTDDDTTVHIKVPLVTQLIDRRARQDAGEEKP